MKIKHLLLFALIYASFAQAKVDYVRVMFNHNGDSRATIGWNQVSGDSAIVFWGEEDVAPERYLEYTNVSHVASKNQYKGMNNCFVRMHNLSPDKAYYFVIKDSEGISERYWFKTTPNEEGTRLSLVAGGDSRTKRDVRQKAFKMVGKLVPHAILFDGDYTDIDTEEKWKWWMEDYMLHYKAFGNKIVPIVTTRGNHEKNKLCLPMIFDCPDENSIYNVTMGGSLVNILCLNTEIRIGGKQKKFIEECLIEHEHYTWQIPMYHKACRPHVNWKMKFREVRLIYRKWIHLFEKYGVRLAIECDSHITKTTWPIVKNKSGEDGFIRDDENGIVYAGEGCWGAPLRTPDRKREWTRDADKVNSFKWLFVDQNQITMRTVAYMNVDEVANSSEAQRFNLPEGIDIWSPANGDVVYIKK